MSLRFKNKTVLITGASSGIGAALAREWADQGANVVITARRQDRLEALRDEIEATGAKVLALPCDVTDRDSIDIAVAAAIESFGQLDVVVANAGFGIKRLFQNLETKYFRRQFDTNFFGVLDTVYATLPHLEVSGGRLCLIASMMGKMGGPVYSAYSASKFAVVGLAQCMYFDLREKGITVTCIEPGSVQSEFRSVDNAGYYTGRPDVSPSLINMPTPTAARKIIRAVYKGQPEVVLTLHGKCAVFLTRHVSWLMRFVLHRLTKGRLKRAEGFLNGE
jgi:short-subunit dehydrogenase